VFACGVVLDVQEVELG